MLRYKSFRFCMLIGTCALTAVALYYFISYTIVLDIALDNSGVRTGLQASIRALWLGFACQALLIGLLYALVAFRPRAISREVVALLGLLQLLEATLLFGFAGNRWMALLLVATAACVLVGVLIWPSKWPLEEPASARVAAEPPDQQPTDSPG